MKKIVLMLLVAMVPFLTMAQKRSKKNKDVKTEIVQPIPNVNFKASSFTFDGDTKTLTEVVIDKFYCDKGNLFCAALMKSARKKPISFTTSDTASVGKLKSANSIFKSSVKGILLLGKNKFKAELFFDVRKGVDFIGCNGNIVFDGSSLGLKESKLMISFKGIQK